MVAVAVPAPGVGGRAGAVRSAPALARPRRAELVAARYRRRRIVVSSLVLTMLLAGRVVLGMVGGGPLSAPHHAPTVLVSDRVHVVQPGDTLWSIARSLEPEGDVRRLVQQLASQRQGSALQVGERIVLP